MNYGSFPYGSTPIGGSGFDNWQIFLPWRQYPTGEYEAEAEVVSDQLFYEIEVLHGGGFGEAMEYRVYTYNDPGETPQLQVTVGGALYGQTIVGMARFILVQMTAGFNNAEFRIQGRPYNQNN